jgi:hypothetical protein
VTRLIYGVALLFFTPLLFATPRVAAAVQPNETSLRAADAEELRIVLTGDANAMRGHFETVASPNGNLLSGLSGPQLVSSDGSRYP